MQRNDLIHQTTAVPLLSKPFKSDTEDPRPARGGPGGLSLLLDEHERSQRFSLFISVDVNRHIRGTQTLEGLQKLLPQTLRAN